MKILYLAAIRLPTEKAHGLQIMKTCEALADAGAEVELVVPARKNTLMDEPFAYYGMQPSFSIARVHSPDLVRFGRLGFALTLAFFAEGARLHKSFWEADVVYSRDASVLVEYILLGRTFVYEAHTKPTWLSKFVARRAERVVVISKGLQVAYINAGVPIEKIIIAPDGVDLDAFKETESKEAARTRLGLPVDAKIALYIGRLEEGKGAVALCEAANLVRDHITVAMIGGEPQQVDTFKHRYPNVTFLGTHPYRELANNQAAADVLVIPNSGKDVDTAQFTSPLKLFTSMAATRPIVAAEVPALREVLDDDTATFFTPDDAASLAKALTDVFAHFEIATSKAVRARMLVERYTWKERAQKILVGLTDI